MPGVADYEVCGGQRITVAVDAEADADSVRLFLLGSAMGALLHQRGVLPLHGAAVRMGPGYVIVAGDSGAGKSSVSTVLAQRGCALGSDDISAVTLRDGRPYLLPGFPEAKLWPDALSMLNDDASRYGRVRPITEKRRVPIARFSRDELPVTGVVVLSLTDDPTPHIRTVDGGPKMAALKQHTYGGALVVAMGAQALHFRTIAGLAAHAPMWHVTRPTSGGPPSQLAELIEDAVK